MFYGLLDTGYVPDALWETKCRALIEGGSSLIQLRAKRETPAQRRALLERILPLFEGSSVPLIINDDLELALSFPGLGLHIGQDDTPPIEARKRLGPDRLLGLSTHSLGQARAALALPPGTLDYFAVGPVFPTQTKPDYQAVGLELVSAVAALSPALPFWCIGGINRQNAHRVLAAGATRLVAVSDPLLDPDTAGAVRQFRSLSGGAPSA